MWVFVLTMRDANTDLWRLDGGLCCGNIQTNHHSTMLLGLICCCGLWCCDYYDSIDMCGVVGINVKASRRFIRKALGGVLTFSSDAAKRTKENKLERKRDRGYRKQDLQGLWVVI